MKRDDVIWLVKSGGRILGPFDFNNVSKLLREREFNVLDEICEPNRRWQMIRDHKVFVGLLDDLRENSVSTDENTTDSTHLTASLTESLHGSTVDEITEDIGDYQKQLKEIVYDNVSETGRAGPRLSPFGRYQAESDLNEARIQSEAEQNSRWMWWLAGAAIVLVMGAFGIKRFGGLRSGGQAPVDAAAVGLSLFQDGDYGSALDLLRRAYNLDSSRRELWFPLGILLALSDGQSVEAKKLLENSLNEKTESEARVHTALGIVFIQDGDLTSAMSEFKKAINADANFLPALANIGAVSFLQKNFASSRQAINQVMARGLFSGALIIQSTVASVEEAKINQNRELLQEAWKLLQKHISGEHDYLQEMKIVELYLRYLKTDFDKEQMDAFMRRIIDIDPQQTDDFRHPVLLAKQLSDWNHLGKWCKQLTDAAGGTAIATTLQAICFFRQGEISQAKAEIDRAVNQAPKDPLIQSVYAFILRTAGQGSEASVALGRAIELDRKSEYMLPVLLQARFCQEKEDLDCANTYWVKSLQIDSRNPAAKVGLAQIYSARGSEPEAQKSLDEALAIEPEYRPALKMKRLFRAAKSNAQ